MFAPKIARPKTTAAPAPGVGRVRPSLGPPRTVRETRGPSWDFRRVPLEAPSRLAIGPTNDPLEHEADRLADQVMHAPAAGAAPVQASGADAGVVRRAPAGGGPAPAGAARGLFQGAGRALDGPARAFFEPRLGFSLSKVRIHADDHAARAADAIGARAFTAGPDIGFAADQYRPETPSGRRLLAHELVHVAQAGRSPGGEAVVRRAPASPVMYDTGTQSFSPPAAGDTVASVKADIAALQAQKPPALGPTVDVKGVTAGQPEELFVWNALKQRADPKNWGTEIQVVTQIGPAPTAPPGGAAPVGQITIIIDKAGNATAELLDKGATAVPAAFPDKDTAVAALKTDFGFASVDDGTAAWTPGDLNKAHAALSLLPAADRASLAGVALVRDSTLTNKAGKSLSGEFRHAIAVTAGAPGTPSVASRDESLHLADSAFGADSAGFVGEKGKEVLPSLRIALHEAGHAEETKALRDAEFATDTAQAAANNDTLAFNAEQTTTNTAVTAANAAAKTAFAAVKGYAPADQAAASGFLGAFNAALRAVNAYANNSTGSRFAALEAAATKAITARDAAKAKLPAANPAAADFATAITAQDAWFAQAQVRAAASQKLDASKADLATKKTAQKGVSDATGKTSKRLENFVALVNANKIPPLTQYAKDNWPGNPEEFYAEAYSLWLTNPGYLNDNAPKLKAWFDKGEHLK
jgi:hypothetical protein